MKSLKKKYLLLQTFPPRPVVDKIIYSMVQVSRLDKKNFFFLDFFSLVWRFNKVVLKQSRNTLKRGFDKS